MTFYFCPKCESEGYPMGGGCKCATADLPVRLSPCPFCGGPPAMFSKVKRTRVLWWKLRRLDWRSLLSDGWKDIISATAHVFCHECGAQSSEADEFAESEEEARELLPEMRARAALFWQERNQRHARLYASSDADGLNLFPRALS